MKFVIFCLTFLALVSCGGGDNGTVPEKPKPPEPFGMVDLSGNWAVTTTIA